jgi:hypothetical protein
MKTETSILVIERTNQRDGINYLLACDSAGMPKCPHCEAPMSRMNLSSVGQSDVFENSNCRCWWHGADRVDYKLQVVVEATQEGEDAYLARRAAAAAKLREERAAQKKIADEAAAVRRAAFVGKKATTRMQMVTNDYGVQPKKGDEVIEVEIVKAYLKEFSIHQGGATEVFDVRYPDGRVFFLRAKQVKVLA